MNKRTMTTAHGRLTRLSYLLLFFALPFILPSCGDDDPDSENKAQIAFKVFEYNNALKATGTSTSNPVADATISIYTKSGDKYTLKETLKTNSAGEATISGKPAETVYYEVKKGNSMSPYNGYIVIGTFESQTDIDNYPYQGPDTKIGDLRFQDSNDDGKIDEKDKVNQYIPIEFGSDYITTGRTVIIAPLNQE